MSTSQTVFTYEKTLRARRENDIHNVKMGEKIVVIIYSYRDRAIFLLFWVHQDIKSE